MYGIGQCSQYRIRACNWSRFSYGEAADRKFQRNIETLRKADPHGNKIDVGIRGHSREKQGKMLWILQTLEDKYGEDFFKRLIKELKKSVPSDSSIEMDGSVKYMSQAAGEDLKP